MQENKTLKNLAVRTQDAVGHYWRTRSVQRRKQQRTGKSDQGARGAVTGGAQMDGFIRLFTDLICDVGIARECVYYESAVELPGFFRPTKEWDLLVVKNGTLVAAIEAKSQVGPSFGNNFNNRTEEALGSALDLWTAYREGAYVTSPQPFLGYFFMLEDSPASNHPVRVKEPHFKVFPEFVGSSYSQRYELFCRKLVLERHYTSAAFITSQMAGGEKGEYTTPADDLSMERFARTLIGHLATVA
jgi:hypothetical protein